MFNVKVDKSENKAENKSTEKKKESAVRSGLTDHLLQSISKQTRSDLFLESAGYYDAEQNKQSFSENHENLYVKNYERKNLQITEVKIETQEQSQKLNRPKGTYITLESSYLKIDDEEIHESAAEEIAFWIQKLLPENAKTVLVTGLGNKEAVPDALGPDTAAQVRINRHLVLAGINNPKKNTDQSKDMSENRNPKQENHDLLLKKTKHNCDDAEEYEEFSHRSLQVCALIPGVMAQTGMETAEILKAVANHIKPDVIIVIDALAARSVTRLGTTIQLTDTGIAPGSGIGNCRSEISSRELQIPVLAIGIPMVVEAASIIYETVEAIRQAYMESNHEKEAGFLQNFTKEEQYEIFRELLEVKAEPLYVTVKDIDELEKRLAFTISEGLNRALFC